MDADACSIAVHARRLIDRARPWRAVATSRPPIEAHMDRRHLCMHHSQGRLSCHALPSRAIDAWRDETNHPIDIPSRGMRVLASSRFRRATRDRERASRRHRIMHAWRRADTVTLAASAGAVPAGPTTRTGHWYSRRCGRLATCSSIGSLAALTGRFCFARYDRSVGTAAKRYSYS